jgi:hypothetical protein
MRLAITVFLSALSCLQVHGQQTVDPTIPPPAQILGYEIGHYVTDHASMERYALTLAQVAPHRVRLVRYGQSYERRPMYLAIVSDERNLEQLDHLRARWQSLRTPDRLPEGELKARLEGLPAVAWLNFANDGNESAAFEAGLELLWQLTARTDSAARAIRRHVVVLLNLAHNPDSHERYVAWFRASLVGPEGTADPWAQEHQGDWRMSTNNNHYQIDLNRDAFAATQQETRFILEQFHRWKPHLFIDHHGETKNMFFPPYAIPVNPHVPASTVRWAQRFGEETAREFGRRGWAAFTAEVFDLHYPGYWDSYPALNGAIGMTFETDGGGRKGLRWEREDGTIVTFREAIDRHVVASWSMLELLARHREEVLSDYYRFFASGMMESEKARYKALLLPPDQDPHRLRAFLELLRMHDIEIRQARGALTSQRARDFLNPTLRRMSFPEGSFLVLFRQPQARLIRALLEPDVPLDPLFVSQARQARDYNRSQPPRVPREPLGFYDTNFWSLPVAYGLLAYWTEDVPAGPYELMQELPALQGGVERHKPVFAYLIRTDQEGGRRLVAQLLRRGIRLAVARKAFTTAEGVALPSGTAVVRVERNTHLELERLLDSLAQAEGVRVLSTASPYTPEGPDLGSNDVHEIHPPRLAVVTEAPTSATAYGAIWFWLERRLGYPFTALRADQLGRIPLQRYDVLILPHGSPEGYSSVLGRAGAEALRRFVEMGGVLITLKGASVWAADSAVGLSTTRLLGAKLPKPSGEEDEEEGSVDYTPGAAVVVEVDTLSAISAGFVAPLVVHIQSEWIFTPSRTGRNAVRFAAQDPVRGGFAWEETKARFPGNAYAVEEFHARGRVVLFADDPLFRLFWRGTEGFLFNAIFWTGGW